jgi:hypothetical protein
MNRLTAEQCRRNRNRDDQWKVSAHHRRNVTERIVSLAHGGRLCVLGAGNSNDLDLPRLATVFDQIHLYDIDGEALSRGLARQFETGGNTRRAAEQRATIHLHPGVDLTGIWDDLDTLSIHPPTGAALDELIGRAANPPLPLDGRFDVAVSLGLVSQLIDGVVRCAPESCPKFMELLLSVRSGHLRLLARLTAPGGHGLLITDFVSSATAAELATARDAELGALVDQLAAQGNFFHGLNPLFLPALFQQDPVLHNLIAGVTHRGFWIWNQRARQYAVLAIEFERYPTDERAG